MISPSNSPLWENHCTLTSYPNILYGFKESFKLTKQERMHQNDTHQRNCEIGREIKKGSKSYTLNVPDTVSLADLTAASISNTPAKEPPLLVSSEDLAAEYEFQSASREEDEDNVVCWREFSLSPTPPENHFCIV